MISFSILSQLCAPYHRPGVCLLHTLTIAPLVAASPPSIDIRVAPKTSPHFLCAELRHTLSFDDSNLPRVNFAYALCVVQQVALYGV